MKDYLCLILGTALMAFAINSIYDPIGLVTGGFSGIAIIVRDLTKGLSNEGIPLGLTNFVLNIPFFFLAVKMNGFSFVKKTLAGTFLLSLWLYLLPSVVIARDDFILAAVFGGAISGVGIGLVFRAGATTGGSDLVAALIWQRIRQFSVARIMMVIDGIIVAAGIVVFGIDKALYALIAIWVVTKVTDHILEGVNFSKIAFIITRQGTEVAGNILDTLDRGVTAIECTGMYSLSKKKILFCVVSKKEIVDLKKIVKSTDSEAFITISDAREVLGEGFLEN